MPEIHEQKQVFVQGGQPQKDQFMAPQQPGVRTEVFDQTIHDADHEKKGFVEKVNTIDLQQQFILMIIIGY